MAVEKVKMMNVVARLSDIEDIILKILKSNRVNIVDSQIEIENNSFSFGIEDEKDLERNIELNYISNFERDLQKEDELKKAKELLKYFKYSTQELENSDLSKAYDDFYSFYNRVIEKEKRLSEITDRIKIISNIKGNYELYKNLDLDFGKLQSLKYFEARFGILDNDARFRLKSNYGNILATIIHTATIDNNAVYLCIYPKDVANEVDRILKSLNWQEVNLFGEYKGTALEIINKFAEEEAKLLKEKLELEQFKQEILKDEDRVKATIYKSLLIEKIEDIKRNLTKSNKYFYLSGFVGESDVDYMKKLLEGYEDIHISFKDQHSNKLRRPTKLKNSKIIRPFETLVKMYGIPGYDEVDPTLFFGITYMILFGAMFGDLGQGFVFLLVGIFLATKGQVFGDIIARLGIASMFFGLMYGSVFGNEHIIPAVFMRPFESINEALGVAVGFGIILITISFIIGFINKRNRNEEEELLFGKEGIAGFIVFVMMVNIAISLVLGIKLIPITLALIIIAFALITMIFKKPLTAILLKEKLVYEDGAVSYYIESVASLIEAVISILSNIISFIRVGAFAINHVGLYMAFETLGKMANNGAANIIILIIGNIIIMGLEGLIVFIQSLRLEYYEMFGKYYYSDGYEFKAQNLKLKEN